jgi:hypothetical protein
VSELVARFLVISFSSAIFGCVCFGAGMACGASNEAKRWAGHWRYRWSAGRSYIVLDQAEVEADFARSKSVMASITLGPTDANGAQVDQ